MTHWPKSGGRLGLPCRCQVEDADVLATSSSSIPWHRPSTSAAWIRNSLENHISVLPSRTANMRRLTCSTQIVDPRTLGGAQVTQLFSDVRCLPLLTSMSVIVCHLFMATNHLSSPRRQLQDVLKAASLPHRRNVPHLTSTTSLSLLASEEMRWSRSGENFASGNR